MVLASQSTELSAATDPAFPHKATSDEYWMDTDRQLQHRILALSTPIAEDNTVVQINPDDTDHNAGLSITAPFNWVPEE